MQQYFNVIVLVFSQEKILLNLGIKLAESGTRKGVILKVGQHFSPVLMLMCLTYVFVGTCVVSAAGRCGRWRPCAAEESGTASWAWRTPGVWTVDSS